jgi:hypothetical protein
VPLFGPGGSTGYAYHHIIDDYDDNELNNAVTRKALEMCADELITADEAKAFVAWMRTRRKTRATIHSFALPIAFDMGGLGSSRAVGDHRLQMSDDPDYDLPFRTAGYWSEVPLWQDRPLHRM